MNYYVKRVLYALLTLFTVVTLAYVMFRLMPGNPIEAMRANIKQDCLQTGRECTRELINRRLEQKVGDLPEGPIYIRYLKYLWNISVEQDFGRSLWRSKPVFEILFKAMPWSVFLSVYGLLLGFTTNIILGAFMAYKEGSRFDSGTTVLIVVLNSVPYYAVALVSLSILAFQFNMFPTGGRVTSGTTPGVNWPYIAGVIQHAALPILSSFVVGFGGGALAMRGNSVRVLGEDYLRVARLRGLRTQRIATRYVAKNAVLPMYTTLMIGISALFSSSVILEQIFTYPGVGWYTYGALLNRDYPLLMGSFIFYTTLTVTGILLADLTYGLIDPRVKSGGERESF